jgi:hypothetical protein
MPVGGQLGPPEGAFACGCLEVHHGQSVVTLDPHDEIRVANEAQAMVRKFILGQHYVRHGWEPEAEAGQVSRAVIGNRGEPKPLG